MQLLGKNIGFALTGSFCTFDEVVPEIEKLILAGANVTPVMSSISYDTDTKFGRAADWLDRIEQICGHPVIARIVDAEPIGPGKLFDLLIVAPCTGNTLAKLANGITDTPVTMAVKAHLRNARPVLIAVSTNDGLGLNAQNLGRLIAAKHMFFVPFGQDSPLVKPTSLVARMSMIPAAAEAALDEKQIEPVIIERWHA
jgi:dipicolinate synthase subunit B